MAARSRVLRSASPEEIERVINACVGELRQAMDAKVDKFFPNGIELISITVKLAGIDVSFKVAGPKATSLMGSANMQSASLTS